MKAILSNPIKSRIKKFQNDRLKLLQQVCFSDLFKSHSFTSGEIVLASDFIYYRLDEYFSAITSELFQKLLADLTRQANPNDPQYDVIRKIGEYLYDAEFDEAWNRACNLFTAEFSKDYIVRGEFSWSKLTEPLT
jgi:hypothetical protein